MSDFLFKYRLLNNTARKEVNDFLDFLLSKQKKNKPDPLSSYKKKILTVSTWSESDLSIFDKNAKLFNQWGIQEWS